MNPLRRFATAALVALMLATLAVSPAHAVTIDMVTVGDVGNAADTTGYGSVNYEYEVGRYEVTIQQYTDFLNAAAKGDPYSLYNASMASDLNIAGISRTGSSGSFTYSVIGSGNRPITYVNWFDAARFANWMHNGQGSGSTETGAYTLVGGQTSGMLPARNFDATFYIPTENEWYKAAYYSTVLNSGSGGYWTYATQSNTEPGNFVGGGANQANYGYLGYYSVTQSQSYSSGLNYLTEAGAYTNSASYYGTFDQNGNVYEWNDLTGAAGWDRGKRGGGWGDGGTMFFRSDGRIENGDTTMKSPYLGFRLASPVAVPEPSTWVMGAVGIACAGWGASRRRKRA